MVFLGTGESACAMHSDAIVGGPSIARKYCFLLTWQWVWDVKRQRHPGCIHRAAATAVKHCHAECMLKYFSVPAALLFIQLVYPHLPDTLPSCCHEMMPERDSAGY